MLRSHATVSVLSAWECQFCSSAPSHMTHVYRYKSILTDVIIMIIIIRYRWWYYNNNKDVTCKFQLYHHQHRRHRRHRLLISSILSSFVICYMRTKCFLWWKTCIYILLYQSTEELKRANEQTFAIFACLPNSNDSTHEITSIHTRTATDKE